MTHTLAGRTRAWLVLAMLLSLSSAGVRDARAQSGDSTAAITGTVRDDQKRPVRGARVSVLGTTREAVTGESGMFSLDGIPGGAWTVEARLIGFQPVRVAVALVPGQASTVELTFGARVTVLESELILARRLTELERRRRVAISGHFIMGDEIDRRGPNAVLAQILQQAPGVRVDSRPGAGWQVTMNRRTGYCTPSLYVDGVRDLIGDFGRLYSDEIAGIEVYPRDISRPFEFQDRNQCGAIAVWTRPLPPEQLKSSRWRWVVGIGLGIVAIIQTLRILDPLGSG